MIALMSVMMVVLYMVRSDFQSNCIYLQINSFLILTIYRIFSLAEMIALISAMMVVIYVVSSDLRGIVILTEKLIPDSDSVADIFISEDDSINEFHDGGSICGKFRLA